MLHPHLCHPGLEDGGPTQNITSKRCFHVAFSTLLDFRPASTFGRLGPESHLFLSRSCPMLGSLIQSRVRIPFRPRTPSRLQAAEASTFVMEGWIEWMAALACR